MSDGCGCSGEKYDDSLSKNTCSGFIKRFMVTPAGEVPVVDTKLTRCDRFGSLRVRLGMGRMSYSINPGLYAVGTPSASSPVLVTANYKLTFDHLRSSLAHTDAWILVLDTKGINVWCAAGKGTFSTKELIKRILGVRLSTVVSHTKIILPQLGAVGVAAHEVAGRTGFSVKYGPVYARDVERYLAAGMVKDENMRQVHFDFIDRIVLVPMELVAAWMFIPILAGIGFIFELVAHRGYAGAGFEEPFILLGGLMCGAVIVPALLPLFPVRAFSAKGFIAGIIWTALAGYVLHEPLMLALAQGGIVSAVSAFLAMQFTGASTFTSQTGVQKEVRRALPFIIALGLTGLIMRTILAIMKIA